MRSVIFATASATVLSVPGCGSDGGTTAPAGGKVTGTYTLEYADEEELPVAVHRGSYLDPATGNFYNNFVLEVTNGYIELRENETFYVALQLRITADGQSQTGTFDFEGEWDEIKGEIILRVQWPVVGTQVLERDGNWLTMDVDFLGLGEETQLDFDLFKR
jgi:hypothetical protein